MILSQPVFWHASPKCSDMQAQSPEQRESCEENGDGKLEASSSRVDGPGKQKQQQRQQQKSAISKTKQKKLLREEQEKEQKAKVIESFHGFYKAQYQERWPTLLSAMEAKQRSACLVNKFADQKVFEQNMVGVGNLRRLPFISALLYECDGRFPHPERDDRNILTCYLMDAASVLAAEALEVAPHERVLDLCAAPGGKSVVLLQHLQPQVGSLTANEMSADRRRRLWKVMMDYIPEDLRHCVQVTGRDGTQWLQPDLFDKVLVDAPCSSERHLLQDQEELSKWTEQRTTHCAKRQLALLNAALKNVRVGGLVVYSTCSISNVENDEVIEKARKKRKVDFEIVQKPWHIGERTEYGWIVLPDTANGWGPLYFCVLRRVS